MPLADSFSSAIPASWCEHSYFNGKDAKVNGRNGEVNGHANGTNGSTPNITEGKFVRTVYGTVPLKFAMGWPVVASYDELAGCAQWMGGRIPTMEEVRSIYSYVESMKPKFEKSLGNTIPAVNGYAMLRLIEPSADICQSSHQQWCFRDTTITLFVKRRLRRSN
jgi:hypothetical protein